MQNDDNKIKRVLSVVDSFELSAKENRAYWHSKTPSERLCEVEKLRRINYGDKACARLQRILEVTQRK